MACIEFHVNNRIFKLDNGTRSDVVATSDWDIVSNLINRQDIPEGYTLYEIVSGKDKEINNKKDFIEEIIKVNSEGEESNNKLVELLKTHKISQTEFIEKFIGNQSIDSSLQFSKDLHSHNALYISSIGSCRWYGFTKNRMFMITGSKFRNQTDKILANAYELLKTEDSKGLIHTIIGSLAKEYNISNKDIYSTFTTLSNGEHKLELISKLSLPLIQAEFNESPSIVRKIIKNNTSSVLNKIVFYNNHPCMIKERGNMDSIKVQDLITGTNENMPIKEIKNVYNAFTVENKNGMFILLNGVWYKDNKSSIVEVSKTESKSLFKTFFSIGENTIIVNKPNITKNTNINGATLSDILSEGDSVYTNSGIFTKKEGKLQSNGRELNDDVSITRIVTTSMDPTLLSEFVDFTPEVKRVSTDQVKVLMHDIYGFRDFDNLKVRYSKNIRPFDFRSETTEDGNNIIITMQGLNNSEISVRLMRYMHAAMKFYEFINNPTNKSHPMLEDIHKSWMMICNILDSKKGDSQIKEWLESNMMDVNSIEDATQVLDEKVSSFVKQYNNSKNKLFEELMSCGIIEWTCSI